MGYKEAKVINSRDAVVIAGGFATLIALIATVSLGYVIMGSRNKVDDKVLQQESNGCTQVVTKYYQNGQLIKETTKESCPNQ